MTNLEFSDEKFDPDLKCQVDEYFYMAVVKTCRQKIATNTRIKPANLLKKLSSPLQSKEKLADYMKMPKSQQDRLKDVGGYILCYLPNGKRIKGNGRRCTGIVLDIDFASFDVWRAFSSLYGCFAILHSTRKSTPENPRFRLIILLDREVSQEEHEAVGRMIAGDLGIEMFDDTTFQMERIMYWPSASSDSQYIFHFQDGPLLAVDDVLERYDNWKDRSKWPCSSKRVDRQIHRLRTMQKDPLLKEGVIGAWCRTYNIHQAIEKFLGHIYDSTDDPNRYTYKAGSTSGGVVVYDDKFCYSHHSTDPASGRLCNSFDLVRIHLFGHLDNPTR